MRQKLELFCGRDNIKVALKGFEGWHASVHLL